MRKRKQDTQYYENSAPAIQIRTLLEQWKAAGRIKSSSEVARAIGISPASLSNLAWGKIGPNIETLAKIASYFGVTTDYLLGREMNEKAAKMEIAISSYIGLSSEAITTLHNLQLPNSPKYMFEIVNAFINKLCNNPALVDGDLMLHIKAVFSNGQLSEVSTNFTGSITSVELDDNGQFSIHGEKQEAE